MQHVMCGGMTLGELLNARPHLRQAIKEYWHFYGKAMAATKLHTIEHKHNGKPAWTLCFELQSDAKIEILPDVYRAEVVEFASV